MQPVLETKHISKSFPGVQALDDVSIQVYPGEVHGVVGENGAGKSTLMSILAGTYPQNSGEIFLRGEPVSFHTPQEAMLSGISIVHQELSVVPNLTVAENVFANRQPVNKLNFIDRRKLYADTRALMADFGITDISPDTQVRFLSIAQQQVVEINKAISINPAILILDEPTSSLTSQERKHLFEMIRRLKAKGTSFIYISHHLDEIFEVCDSISILKDGKFVCRANVPEIDEHFIIKNMVGREIGSEFAAHKQQAESGGEVVLETKKLYRMSEFADMDFSIRAGEIVGMFGLVGAGRTEFAASLFGLTRAERGEILWQGKRVRIHSPRQAMELGIAYVSEDRKSSGLYLNMNIRQNLIANKINMFAKGPFMDRKKTEDYAGEAIGHYGIVASGQEQYLRNLSGGNQQKVLLAGWLSMNPKLLIVDEPTKGVDIGARSEIYEYIIAMAAKGTAVLMISSDLLEILGMSDRTVIMKDGFIAGELSRDEMSEEHILEYATGITNKGVKAQ